MKKIVLTTIALCALTAGANAAVLLGFDFSTLTGGSGNYGPSPFAYSTLDTGLTSASGLTRGAGLGTGGTGAGKAWGGTGNSAITTEAAAITASEFASFSVTSNVGTTLSFASIDAYNIRRSGTGPTTGIWQYKVGAGAFTDIGSAITWGAVTNSAGNPQSAIDLTGISALQNLGAGTTVTFRVVTWGGTGSGTWYLNDPASTVANDLTISGAVPEPSTSAMLLGGAGAMFWILRRKRAIKG